MIFLDLEFYVPENQRKFEGYTLRANPCKDNQFLMGGVFVNTPLFSKIKDSDLKEFWVWNEIDFNKENVYPSECRVLEKIYSFIKEGWTSIKRRKDLLIIGIGIARVDLPFLFFRSIKYDFATDQELFSLFFSSKSIDLSNVGSALNPGEILHPLSSNDIMRVLDIKSKKPSGMRVWDHYDLEEFKKIEERTKQEILVTIKAYHLLRKKLKHISPK